MGGSVGRFPPGVVAPRPPTTGAAGECARLGELLGRGDSPASSSLSSRTSSVPELAGVVTGEPLTPTEILPELAGVVTGEPLTPTAAGGVARFTAGEPSAPPSPLHLPVLMMVLM